MGRRQDNCKQIQGSNERFSESSFVALSAGAPRWTQELKEREEPLVRMSALYTGWKQAAAEVGNATSALRGKQNALGSPGGLRSKRGHVTRVIMLSNHLNHSS